MESKTKHRILGVIVMAGIAVLMYPILQNRTDALPDEQHLVKAPPFPDQTIQVSSSTEPEIVPADYQVQEESLSADITVEPANMVAQPDAVETTPPEATVATPAVTLASSSAPSAGTEHRAPGPMSTKDDHEECVIIDIRPPHLAETKAAPAEKAVNASIEQPQQAKPKKVAQQAKTKHKTAKHKSNVAKKTSNSKLAKKPTVYSKISNKKIINAYKQQPLDDNGLLQLKNAAWVIQLGSFKDKTNALKLVNKLRSKGYRAFIQKYSAASGEHTRVFVGPEHQQKSARLVAAELKTGMKLSGIVISYKPFTL